MMKNNKCKVCSLFNERKLVEEVIFDINKMIKQGQNLNVLNKQTGFGLSEYHYKKHCNTCLLNFETPIDKKIDNVIDNLNNQSQFVEVKKSYQEMLNIDSIMEKYRKMSFEDKQIHKLELLNEIEYLVISNVHYQLINGCIDVSFKHLVPKEDISSLKAINDIMKTKSEDNQKENNHNEYEKLSFEKLSKIEQIIDEK